MNSEIGYAQALDAPKYELMEGLKHSLGKLITLINKNGYLSALYKDFYCEEGLLGNISKNPENTLENISRIEIVRVHFSWAKEGQELQIFKLAASIKDEILVLLQIQIRSNVSILLNLVYGLEMGPKKERCVRNLIGISMYEANAKTEMNLDGIDSVISYFKEIPESSLIGEIPNLPDEMLKLAEQIRYDFSGLLEQAKPLEQVA